MVEHNRMKIFLMTNDRDEAECFLVQVYSLKDLEIVFRITTFLLEDWRRIAEIYSFYQSP